jgi:hypothetical protein
VKHKGVVKILAEHCTPIKWRKAMFKCWKFKVYFFFPSPSPNGDGDLEFGYFKK